MAGDGTRWHRSEFLWYKNMVVSYIAEARIFFFGWLLRLEVDAMVNIRLGVPVLFPLALAGANALSERQLLNQTYDYIIVGGGTSGLTVANRLTANGKRTSSNLYSCLCPLL